MALFKKKVELDRFLQNAIAAAFAGGFPISKVDSRYAPTAEQRIKAAEVLRIRSLVAHYFALVARIGTGIPVGMAELSERYRSVLWYVLIESARSRQEAEAIATCWEAGVEEVIARLDDESADSPKALAEVTSSSSRILRNSLKIDDHEYYAWAAKTVTEHSVRAPSFALDEVQLV